MNQQQSFSPHATPHWHAQLPDGRVIGPITSDELQLLLSQNALPSGAIIVNDEGSLHPSCIAMTADDCAANSGRQTANYQPPPLPPHPPSELDMMRQAIGRSRRNPRKKVPVLEGWIRLYNAKESLKNVEESLEQLRRNELATLDGRRAALEQAVVLTQLAPLLEHARQHIAKNDGEHCPLCGQVVDRNALLESIDRRLTDMTEYRDVVQHITLSARSWRDTWK